MEGEGLDRAIFGSVVSRLEEAGMMVHGGSVIDATIVSAPSSTKNARGGRDPEMHQAKKGNRWYHGMKCHSGEDAGAGYVHSCAFTAANASDVAEAHGLVRADDRFCYADAGYRGVGKRDEVASDERLSAIDWRVAMGPSRLRALCPARWADRDEERRKASVRSKAEHPYHIVKRVFGYAKCRYRGIAKNAARIRVLLASANLLMVARAGRQADFPGPSLGAA